MKRFCFLAVLFFATVISVTSCHYRLYRAKDKVGRTHKVRGYRSYKQEHKYYDRHIVKYKYKPQTYNREANFIAKTDTSIDCDSIRIFVLDDSRQYAAIFTTGIVPARLLSAEYGSLNRLPGKDYDPWIEHKDTGVKNLIIFDLHPLTYIKSKRGHKFFQFHCLPFWFYIELTNKKARRKTKPDVFLKDAQLTWFYKSSVIDL